MEIYKKIDDALGSNLTIGKSSYLAPMMPEGLIRGGRDRPWNGGDVAKTVKLVTGLQSELYRALKGEDSPFYKKYLNVRNSVMEWFGRVALNPDQILQLQLAGTKDLIEAMKALHKYGDGGLKALEDYRELLLTETPTHTGSMESNLKSFNNLKGLYDELKGTTSKLTVFNDDYVGSKLRQYALEENMRENRNAYRMSHRSIDHYLRTRGFYDNIVRLMSDSLQLSAEIALEADMMVNDVNNIRHVPGIINAQGQIAGAIEKSMGTLADHVDTIFSRMERGVNSLHSAGYDTRRIIDFYATNESKVGRFIDSIGDAKKEFDSGLKTRTGRDAL